MTKGNEPAFPADPVYKNDGEGGIEQIPPGSFGLTKREYFAAKAMEGSLASEDIKDGILWSDKLLPQLAQRSVMVADALIAALEE